MIITFDLETLTGAPEICPSCKEEIAAEIPEASSKDEWVCPLCGTIDKRWNFSNKNWKDHLPFLVSCGAAGLIHEGEERTFTWQGDLVNENHPEYELKGRMGKSMTPDQLNEMTDKLIQWQNDNHLITAWNGAGFDFRVLDALLPERHDEISMLAAKSIDPMFYVVATKTFTIGLDKACQGMEVTGKLKKVTLTDGTVLKSMTGRMAPKMWLAGETKAVIEYLKEDVLSLARLMEAIVVQKHLRWITSKGELRSMPYKLDNVATCNKYPKARKLWDNAKDKSDFVDWMNPAHIFSKQPKLL